MVIFGRFFLLFFFLICVVILSNLRTKSDESCDSRNVNGVDNLSTTKTHFVWAKDIQDLILLSFL
jgi:hypothetical protein